jgi:phosphonate metabolism protein PhnN/1,5-bisphosphokinase (PRPP-forming)
VPSNVQDAPKGVLVLVVGPSGAGKDTLMDAARARLAECRFARRLITRPAMIGAEDHDSCTPAEFEAAVARGEIALHWQAHGLSYGIPAQALAGVAQGEVVVANVSRGVIAQAEALGSRVVVVNITAPPDVLAKRLSLRGRESEADIAARLARDAPLRTSSAELVTISNDRTVDEGAAELVGVIAALSPHRRLSSS